MRVQGGKVTTHPIAGTRPRGATRSEDARLEQELLADEKERAEHLMLVDLGAQRHRAGRARSARVQRAALHAGGALLARDAHRVARWKAELQDGLGPVDVLRACFPAGTVSGAPKVRAMQIIAELEQRQARALCGRGGLHRLRRQHGHRDQHPHGGDQGRRGDCAGRGGHRGRQRARAANMQETMAQGAARCCPPSSLAEQIEQERSSELNSTEQECATDKRGGREMILC